MDRVGVSRAVSWLIVGTLGAFEGIYGRTQYLGDWISYLNVSRAVSGLNWKGIFDPMWSPGYPVLVALARAIFPQTAEGEWNAINLLNWLIFLMAYGCWLYLIRQALEFYEPSLTGFRCVVRCVFCYVCAVCYRYFNVLWSVHAWRFWCAELCISCEPHAALDQLARRNCSVRCTTSSY